MIISTKSERETLGPCGKGIVAEMCKLSLNLHVGHMLNKYMTVIDKFTTLSIRR